jgi:hypothetical protein
MTRYHLSAIALAASAVFATSAEAMTPVSGGPQIVLYMTQSLWSGGKPVRLYGVRIDEIRPLPNSPLVTTVGLVQRRELLNLQVVPHSDVRIQLGRRLTWDFTSEEFGPQSGFSRLAIGLPITNVKSSQTDNLQPWDQPRAFLSSKPRNIAGDSGAGGMSVTLLTTVATFPGRSNAVEILPTNRRLSLEPVSSVCNLGSC